MNVSQTINAASPSEVARLYAVHWVDDDWADEATFRRFTAMLNATVGVSEPMRAVITAIPDEFGERDGAARYDVSGDDGIESNWSLGFTSWSEWKLMEVVDRSGANLSTDILAASLYFEMTWHGWPEDMIDRRDDVLDRAEAVRREVE